MSMKEVELDFSKWENRTGQSKYQIGTMGVHLLANADKVYLDEDTLTLYAPVASVELFEDFYGEIMDKEENR